MIKIIDLLCDTTNQYKFTHSGNIYSVEDINNGLAAEIDADGHVEYYVTGCYNSSVDWSPFSMDALIELKGLCEELAKDMQS